MFISEHYSKHKGHFTMLNERQKEIMELLYQKGKVTVAELAQILFVTEMTVRRDLTEMEKGGFLRRFRGGAVLKINLGEMPITQRLHLDKSEKEALAIKCIPFLHDGMSVFIDSSSTCQYLIPHLCQYKNIVLITNSVSALLTAGRLHLPCILVGGEYYEQDMCMVGSMAEQAVRDLNVDIAFFTTAAISDEGIISDFDLRQTTIRKLIMENAKQSIFLFEKEKQGKKLLYTLCNTRDATAVLTVDEE